MTYIDTSAEAVEAAWEEYEASAKPCGNDGDMEFYNVDGMAEEAHNLYTIAKALAADRDALRAQLVIAEAQAQTARDALTECVEEIDGYIQQEYPCDHPAQERRRQRDYAANPARIALALIQPTPTTDRPDAVMQEAMAMDAAMVESMGAGKQPLAFAQDEVWMQLEDAILGKWDVVDDYGTVHGTGLTRGEAQSMLAELTQ